MQTTWVTTYILASLVFTGVFFLSGADALRPQLLFEAVFYWCMIFMPPLMVVDLTIILTRRIRRLFIENA